MVSRLTGSPFFQLIHRPPIHPLHPPDPTYILPPHLSFPFIINRHLPTPAQQLIREMAIEYHSCPPHKPEQGYTDGLLVDEEDVEGLERGEGVERGCWAGEEEREEKEEGEEEGTEDREDYR